MITVFRTDEPAVEVTVIGAYLQRKVLAIEMGNAYLYSHNDMTVIVRAARAQISEIPPTLSGCISELPGS